MKKPKIILLGVVGIAFVFIVIQAVVININIKDNYLEVSRKWKLVETEISKKEPNLDSKYETITSYNEALKEYNISIRKFPNKLYASIFGYKIKDYYVAKADDKPK